MLEDQTIEDLFVAFNFEKQRLAIFKHKTIAHETHLSFPVPNSNYTIILFSTYSETSITRKKLDGNNG